MQKLCFLVAILFSVGSDAFFLNLFKPKYKQHQSFNYNRVVPGYGPPPPHSFAPTQGSYKVPVWQAVPSGYNSQPYLISSHAPPLSHSNLGFSSPDPNTYGYPSSAVKFPSSYDGGFPSLTNPYETGNGLDYTGGRPVISVPVFIPKDEGNFASVPSIYSNGVSGFYDSSLAGSSSSVSVVGQVVPVPVPLPSATMF